eukprot:jgi/Botrbrau1/7240/Bobra.0021s0023.1
MQTLIVAPVAQHAFVLHNGRSPRRSPVKDTSTLSTFSSAKHVSAGSNALSRSHGARRPLGKARGVSIRASAGSSAQKYDFILVGGGTAACVLANRLTADGKKSVLLLEAGGAHGAREVTTPGGLPRLFKSLLDWNLYSTKQDTLDARQVYMARGKLLGGSSCTNATLYMRGTAADYDKWGVPGWGSREALEAMIAAEDNNGGAVPGVHGVGGFMHVEQPRYHNRLHDHFFEACKEAGIPANPDFNDWSHPQVGYGEFQVFQERGERADMYRQYLKPALGRPNLSVVTNAKVLKVATEGKVARGVQYVVGAPDLPTLEAELAAGGEVIMCAGAVHTPQILQLSGIGPAALLHKYGIPVVADLAGVGQNLQDHPAALTAFRAKASVGSISITDQALRESGAVRVRAILAYALFRKGPLTSTGCDHGAFLSTTGSGDPDLQIRFVPGCALSADGINSYVDFSKNKAKFPTGVTFQLLCVRPKSRGSISLRSPDPFDAPLLDPGFLRDPADLATLRSGVRISRNLAAQPALAELLEDEYHPGAAVQSDVEVDAYIRSSLHSGNAIVGTCSMGAPGAAGAVVDPELRVVGFKGLRVVDASVIPVIPGGQTGAAVVMVAERAAKILARSDQPQVVPPQPVPAVPALA